MKKCLLLAFVGLFVMIFSIGVLAEDYGILDDITNYMENYIYTEDDPDHGYEVTTGEGVYNVSDMYRSASHLDTNWPKDNDNDQDVAIDVEAVAYIPCYLELQLTGNGGNTTVQSFGPDMKYTANYNVTLIFDNAIGGFVDADWFSLGANDNAEIEPQEGVYIQGCDLLKASVYCNDTYRYQVESAGLAPKAENTGPDNSFAGITVLPLDMRSALVPYDDTWSLYTFNGTNLTAVIADKAATEELEVYHQFRVPYTREIPHGEYNGTITFRAFSL